MKTMQHRGWQTWVVGAAITGAASMALGQVAPIYSQNGHALDKNPQVGSGGSNSPVAGYVPATGNEIITGNVTGLGGFHGNVPYSSQYEFGDIGSNDAVGRFNRQSAGPAINGNYSGGSVPYYNPSLLVATPANINAGPARQAGVGSGVDATVARNSAYGGRLNLQPVGSTVDLQPSGVLTSPPEANDRYNANAANPFGGATPASGLFGLRQDLRADAPENRYQNLVPSQSTTVNPATTEPGARVGTGALNNQIRTDVGVTQKIDTTVLGGVDSTKIDERMRGGVASALVGQTNKDQLVSDEYRDLLQDLQKSRDEQAKLAAAAPKPKPSTGPEFVIDPITGQLRVRGVDEKGNPLPGGAATQPGGRGAMDKTRDATPALKAARNMPPLETLAGRAGTPFNSLMAGAEIRLKNGKYFEAMDLYQQAMAQQQTNMLPVIGRAHAELGGGMYESAAYDLKFIFEHKSEMMGLRYNLRALIPQERLDFLTKDLKTLADEKKSETAWFLLSYLEYQEGQKDALDLSLSTWAAALPKDAWPMAMRKAWVDAKPEDAKPEEKPGAAGVEQPQTR